MSNPLESPEYAALEAAIAARNIAYARKQTAQNSLLNGVASVSVSEPTARALIFAYQDAVYDCSQADAAVIAAYEAKS